MTSRPINVPTYHRKIWIVVSDEHGQPESALELDHSMRPGLTVEADTERPRVTVTVVCAHARIREQLPDQWEFSDGWRLVPPEAPS
jgi:hypothetical protein